MRKLFKTAALAVGLIAAGIYFNLVVGNPIPGAVFGFAAGYVFVGGLLDYRYGADD